MRYPEDKPAISERLDLLVKALDEEAKLTFLGRYTAHERLTRALANRIRINHALQEFPEIVETPIERPVFVTGFPRTGTTLLLNLLALDPMVRSPSYWEVFQPAPPPTPIVWFSDPRVGESIRELQLGRKWTPEMFQIHNMDPLGPEECGFLRDNTLVSESYTIWFNIPSYARWLSELDCGEMEDSYDEYRSQIQILMFHFPGRRWLSKSVFHWFHLETLLKVFPTACIVRPHRDPAEAIPSLASLYAQQRKLFTGRVNRKELGVECLERFKYGVAHYRKGKETAPDRCLDVAYNDLLNDPIGVVRNIYQRFGFDYHSGHEAAMRRYLTENPQHKHGKHVYSLEQWGLNDADLATPHSSPSPED